ncbi:hypothetical protein WUBG_02484 [Wuchereria bancrofti]|uniref:Uncharacterized protein n=1 Tax=Wuchereria bancrofti TaxID=6293 RepID=J9FAN5_WUCBA|nr:hypothetical protein WUBG_02484 [Wuchereria bancrofti]
MGRGIKGLRRVQSGQSEEEVLDWTVRSDRTGGRKTARSSSGSSVNSSSKNRASSSATTVSAAKKRCMQQQHPAAASNSGLSAAVPTVEPTTVTVVDRLKHQLLQAYDNVSTVVQCSPSASNPPLRKRRRHRAGHGYDHQIGEVQFDEGITRGEDISDFHPKLRSEEDELGYVSESAQLKRGVALHGTQR